MTPGDLLETLIDLGAVQYRRRDLETEAGATPTSTETEAMLALSELELSLASEAMDLVSVLIGDRSLPGPKGARLALILGRARSEAAAVRNAAAAQRRRDLDAMTIIPDMPGLAEEWSRVTSHEGGR